MVSLDTASFNSGWAYFEAGIRKSSGVIKADGETETRLDIMCRKLIELLDKLKPGTVVIELTVVDRGTATQRLLSEIVGAVRGWAAANTYENEIPVEFVTYRPSVWRKLVCETNEKAPTKRDECKKWSIKKCQQLFGLSVDDNESDAILIGQARINEMSKLAAEIIE